AVGRGALEAGQWAGIWPNIRDFRFDLDQLRSGADGDLGWGIVTWDSIGFDEDGAPYQRPGRATVIFVRRQGAWRALHTHFSLYPGTPGRTHYQPGVSDEALARWRASDGGRSTG